MLATRITCSALRVSAVGISSLEKSCRGQPSALLQARRLPDVLLLSTSSYKAVSGEMPPEVVGQKTSDRSACGSAYRSTGWRGGGRHAFSWARRRDTGFIEASGAMFFLLRRAIGDWYPFFPVASRGNPADTRGRTTSLRSVVPAPVRSSRGQASRRPSPPARSPPQAPRAQGVRRPGPARGPERCGRLGATPGDAPVASTPPRRREPGR